MNLTSFLKLSFGLILIVAVTLMLLRELDRRTNELVSESAKIAAQPYYVGIDYSSVMTRQLVKKGDLVDVNQELFYVKSNTLIEKLNDGKINRADLFYQLNSDNEIILKASRKGYVTTIDYTLGSFIPGNEQIAEILDLSSYQVTSNYKLKERDLARLSAIRGVRLTLPDGTTRPSQIQNVNITLKDESRDLIEVEIESSYTGPASQKVVIQNTPVKTELIFPSNDRVLKFLNSLTSQVKLSFSNAGSTTQESLE